MQKRGVTAMHANRMARLGVTASLALLAAAAQAGVEVGAPAPDFTAVTSTGEEITLSDLRGQRVILEWTNHDCPYVRKHYRSGNMQALQKEASENGYTWLSVISSAPGKQGHVDGAKADKLSKKRDAAPSAVVLDENGAVGKMYGARTTPHMYIVDESGTLVYAGGIDDKPTANTADIEGATNYVRQAMSELDAGKAVSVAKTRPYGCSVKYN
ncbi:MAG: redoxin domain-containing protein [Pseudomonadota bacterium]